MRSIGYTYSADVHCPACAYNAAACGILTRRPPLELGTDEHGLAFDLIDGEGNPVRPFFSTDEPGDAGDYCGDCGAAINERPEEPEADPEPAACKLCGADEDDRWSVENCGLGEDCAPLDEYGRCLACRTEENARGVVRDSLDAAQLAAF